MIRRIAMVMGCMAIFLSVSAAAEKYETQTEMNTRSCDELARAEKSLMDVFNQVLSAKVSDPLFIRKFKRSEQLWEVFRDAHMDAVYPENDKEGHYGSIYPTCRCALLTELTMDRIAQVKRFIEMAEGTACGY